MIFNRRLLAFAGQKSGIDARKLFKNVSDTFKIKGGGHENLCQGGLPKNLGISELLATIKNEEN